MVSLHKAKFISIIGNKFKAFTISKVHFAISVFSWITFITSGEGYPPVTRRGPIPIWI